MDHAPEVMPSLIPIHRQVSDYQIIEPVTLEEAKTALKRTEYFVEAVRIHMIPAKNEKKP